MLIWFATLNLLNVIVWTFIQLICHCVGNAGPYAWVKYVPGQPILPNQPNEGSVKRRNEMKRMRQRLAFMLVRVCEPFHCFSIHLNFLGSLVKQFKHYVKRFNESNGCELSQYTLFWLVGFVVLNIWWLNYTSLILHLFNLGWIGFEELGIFRTCPYEMDIFQYKTSIS